MDKELKLKDYLLALELIVKKRVNVAYFFYSLDANWDYDLFEKYCLDNEPYEDSPAYHKSMTYEEFELVKSVLLTIEGKKDEEVLRNKSVIEKSLKAIDIIKEKRMVWFDYLSRVNTCDEYNKALFVYYDCDEETVKEFYLNEEEFEILREVFDK